ncbi:hypothetical protein ABT214_29255, partial [Micromonospora purpureochromogenes]|uniref:hypothetical protein n=1 Tax=Micromonospora purpureochromogenes TaxID=47872 RepID=UPI00332A8C06
MPAADPPAHRRRTRALVAVVAALALAVAVGAWSVRERVVDELTARGWHTQPQLRYADLPPSVH